MTTKTRLPIPTGTNTHEGLKGNPYWKSGNKPMILITREEDKANSSSDTRDWNDTHADSEENPYWKSPPVVLIPRGESNETGNGYWNDTHAGSKENPYWKSPPVMPISRNDGGKAGNRYWNDTHAGSTENPYWKEASGPVSLTDKRAENETANENPYWKNTHDESAENPHWGKSQA